MQENQAKNILDDLKKSGDLEQAMIVEGYLKTSSLKFIGVKLPEIAKITKKHILKTPVEDLIPIMEALWQNNIYEARRAAIDVMKVYTKKGTIEKGLEIISRWIDSVDTWALMDPLGSNCLGELILRDAQVEKTLIKWRNSSNFWRRRATILPYLYLSLKRNYEKSNAIKILSAMKPHLSDNEFFVEKAVGWVLRELSKREPELVRRFIDEHRSTMTPLVIREGSKKII